MLALRHIGYVLCICILEHTYFCDKIPENDLDCLHGGLCMGYQMKRKYGKLVFAGNDAPVLLLNKNKIK